MLDSDIQIERGPLNLDKQPLHLLFKDKTPSDVVSEKTVSEKVKYHIIQLTPTESVVGDKP